MDRETHAWVLLTLGDDRQYAGNVGYDEDPAREYRYDSFVPNHLQLHVGDTVLLRDRATVLGSGVIESIDDTPATKTRLACPVCDTTGIKERRTRAPRYRCSRGHKFDRPNSMEVACIAYVASFGRSYVPARDVMAPSAIRSAELRSSDQLSIRPIDVDRISGDARAILGWISREAGRAASARGGARQRMPATLDPFAPSGVDARSRVLRAIRARQGQAGFRAALRSRYGDRCMVTGCAAMEVVEAAHISPYRRPEDNHPENGLLLRADLHTLFDLDLMAVNPGTLAVSIDQTIRTFGYENIHGATLDIGSSEGPSRVALQERWARLAESQEPVADARG